MSPHRRCLWSLLVLLVQAPLHAADNPRHVALGLGITTVKTLSQNWTDVESNWFYNVPQGSRLVPYDWFLHLERAGVAEPFRSAKHIRDLGYIPRTPDPKNPDGLPIGFIDDAPYEDGTRGLGMTCSACHTSQINHNGTAYLIDGGPTMGDFERFQKALAAALQATADDDAKFGRFAAAVLPTVSTVDDKNALRATVLAIATQRTRYNERNLPQQTQTPFGPGRVDAFGAIFNEVSVSFLGIPDNVKPANAPVSYPCLWDAPQHDRVQWNGAAENKVTPLGEFLFGTTQVGALGRNSGEVLGVFGSVEINAHELIFPRRYASTVNSANLKQIENSLKTLWSPEWPVAELGPIDANKRTQGELLFQTHCIECHKPINRMDPNRKVVAQLSNVGTDLNMIRNFGRMAKTGRLQRRQKTLMGRDRLAENEPIGVILKHVVERVILNPDLSAAAIQTALAGVANAPNPTEAIDSLNPGYRMTATIEVGQKKLVGRFDSLNVLEGLKVKVGGGSFQMFDKNSDPNTEIPGVIVDLRSLESARAAVGQLESIVGAEISEGLENAHEQPIATLNNATVQIAYKARPLNGIWATAPYLHNGSVPTLAELLKPAARRLTPFHVGGREFDPVQVGFKDDPSQPVFDTNSDGNSNGGHEYGSELTPEKRLQLLEYLKSL